MSQSAVVDQSAPVRGDADLSNWREPPFSAWAFHHVREIMPTANIAVDPGARSAFPQAPKSLDCFSLPHGDGAALTFEQFLSETKTDALVALVDGKLVYEFYGPGMTAQTPHILMSSTKAVIGLLVGVLAGQGAFDLDKPVSDWVPEIANTGYRGATLRQLIDMRGGVVLDEQELAAYEGAHGWAQAPAEGPKDLRAFFQTLKAEAKPHGGPFAYISSNTDLVGWVIERATGRTVPELLSERIWTPMGGEINAYMTLDPKGFARCTGGICTTARDLARLGQIVVDGGACEGRQVVPTAWIDDILQNGDPRAWTEGEWNGVFPYPNMRYRAGWYVPGDEPRSMWAMGIHGQNLFVDQVNRTVIAKLSCHRLPFDYRLQVMTHRAMPEIKRCLLG